MITIDKQSDGSMSLPADRVCGQQQHTMKIDEKRLGNSPIFRSALHSKDLRLDDIQNDIQPILFSFHCLAMYVMEILDKGI